MGSFGPNGQKDLGRARDVKAVELIERGFAAQPTAFQKVKSAGATAAPTEITTVKTDKSVAPASAPAAAEQSSTAKEPAFTFHVTPPEKSP
jgi:D-alanyl-D-alanine carboxypeptidase (penicillin-binding protein 5/6)